MSARQYCTFAVGELLVGIEVARVGEVLIGPEVTPVPHAGPDVVGLLNRRGEIITVLDARRRLGVGTADPGNVGAHVVLGLDGETVSLLVDAEDDVVEVDPQRLQPVPETIRPEVRRALAGIHELPGGRLMVVLELDADQGLVEAVA